MGSIPFSIRFPGRYKDWLAAVSDKTGLPMTKVIHRLMDIHWESGLPEKSLTCAEDGEKPVLTGDVWAGETTALIRVNFVGDIAEIKSLEIYVKSMTLTSFAEKIESMLK